MQAPEERRRITKRSFLLTRFRFHLRFPTLQFLRKYVPVVGLHRFPILGFLACQTTGDAPAVGTAILAYIDTGAFISLTHRV